MTISTDYVPQIDDGNGTTTDFPVNFPFGAQSDLVVTLFDTDTGEDVSPAPVLNGGATYDYTVTGVANADTGIYPSGTVSFNTAPLGTHKVVRARATPQRQSLSLTENGKFPAKSVEGALDRAEMQLQERDEQLSRAILIPASDGVTNNELPPAAERKSKILIGDPDTGAVTVSTFTIDEIQAAPDAAASAAEAETAKTAAQAAQAAAEAAAAEAEDVSGGALLIAQHLNDLTDKPAARTSLGLGTAATHASTDFDAAGAASTAAAAALATAQGSSCQKSANGSDFTSASTTRTNLGIKSMAVRDVIIQSGGSPSGGNDGDICLIY